jgi:hypothetical protein
MPRSAALSSRLLPLGALLLSLSGAALLPTGAGAQETYLWTFDHKVGETERFRTQIEISGHSTDGKNAIEITLKSASKHEYKEVGADGNAIFEQTDEKRETVFNKMPIAFKPEEYKPVLLTVSRAGLYLKRINPNVDLGSAYREKSLLALMSLPAPDKPVKIGDSWTSVIPNPMLRSKTIMVTSTLAGVEKVLGSDALKINLKMEFPSTLDAQENEIVKMEETYYLDVKTHQLLRARYTIKQPVLPFPVGKVEARAVVSRVVPGVNETEDPEEAKLIGVESVAK